MALRRAFNDVSLLMVVNLMWAAQYAAYKTASENMGPVTLTVWIFILATAALLPFRVWERRLLRKPHAGYPEQERDLVRQRSWTSLDVIGFGMVGILGLVPGSVFLAWGELHTTASNAALIYLTVPIITAVMAVLILREKMTLVRWGSLLLSLVGVLILSDLNWRHIELTDRKFLLGNVLVLLACAGSSFYNVYSKRLLERFTPLEVLIYSYILAALVSLLLLKWVEPFSFSAVLSYTKATWFSLIACSVLSYGIAMVLWMMLLKRLDVSQASVSIYLLPFFGVMIASLTLKEMITPAMILGGFIILIGTVIITTVEKPS